ncbi:U6 snRNA-associated Sm-like protein LSm2 [Strongyloides ratti]|uniref:tRNA-intron lyase n=1 Tax=Strongyloides ratti TaxID=34506 RepID=A0A090LJP5_STRRB|nr:U6 snRNA-associated Sm-like protein LSm2 [Strongyloides ratti]CEF69938.1 U6 snRNA-associated Sm-like protein LSm2 [Strongyloides ratti]
MEWEKNNEIKELQSIERIMPGVASNTLSDESLYIDEESLKSIYHIKNVDSISRYNLQKIFIVVIHEKNDNYFLYHKRDAKIAFEKFRIYGEYNKNHVKDPKYLSIPVKLSRIQVQVMIEQGVCLLCQRYVKEECKGQVLIPVDIPPEEVIKKNAIAAVKGRKRKAVQNLVSVICNEQNLENQDNKNYDKSTSFDVSTEEVEEAIEELKNKLCQQRRVVKEGTFEYNFYGCYYLPCELPPNQDTDIQRYGSKLKVFRDLWRKGFWLVDGYKFGGDYLAYDKIPVGNHSRFIVNISPSSKNITPLELIAALRIATQVKKELLLVITDNESLCKNMLFYSFFKSLVGREIVVELKNDIGMSGILQSVDQYLNVKLDQVQVLDPERFPHLITAKNCFIRGSTVRYIQLNPKNVDTELLHNATRKEMTAPVTK